MILSNHNKHLLIRDREPGKGVKLIKETHASVLYKPWDFLCPFEVFK